MKNILLATTALVATAGIASAEVAITGQAELGIFQNENGSGDGFTGAGDKVQVFTDIEVYFTMSGEADNGLTFGAEIDLEDAGTADQTDSARLPNASMFMAFGPARLTVGDTDSAFDARLTETAIGGAINDDHTVHPGYNGNSALDEVYGGQEIRLDYSFDAFTGSISMSPDRFDNFDASFAVGVSYNAELAGLDLGVGLGYIQADEAAVVYDQIIGLSLSTTFNNGLRGILNYSQWTDDSNNGADDANHMAVGIGYTMNALTIGANYGVYDLPAGDQEGYGLAVNYDLGGGLVAQLGYGGGEFAGGGTYEDTFSLGVAMSF